MENLNSVPADIRLEMSRTLASENKYYAQVVADAGTFIEVFPVHFLYHFSIYRVEHRAPHKPLMFYVGFAIARQAYLLTGNPDSFIRMCKADEVAIKSTEAAADYATGYLEVTRSMSELFYVVNSVDEARFRPNLTETEEALKTAFVDKYRDLIEPPAATIQDRDYMVTAYAIREQALERHTLDVSEDGDVEDEVIIIEQNLPLVYGG